MCRRSSLLVAVMCTILSAGPTLVVGCSPPYSELGNRCLLFLPSLVLTWPQANTFCSSTNGSLAIVDDCALLGQIARQIDFNTDLTPDQGYWIGGTDENNEGNFTWVDGFEVPLNMPFWGTYYFQENAYPEPNGDTYQNCLGILSSDRYYFHDVECDRQMSVLCETPNINITELTTSNAEVDGTNEETTSTIEPAYADSSSETSDEATDDTSMAPDTTTTTVPCPPDYVPVGGACFKFFPDSLVSWSAAERLCTNNEGSLATVEECGMLADVAAYIDENGLTPGSLGYWIGATDEASEGLFRWTADDSLVPVRMPFWGTGGAGPEPNGYDIENCVILDASDRYFFHDVMCSNEMAVLCRAPSLLRLEMPRNNDC